MSQSSVLHHYQPDEIEKFIELWFNSPAPAEPVCGFWIEDFGKFERMYYADEAYGLSQILQACRQMVSIMYPANDYNVMFSEGNTSFTNFENKSIVVSVEPIKKAPKGYRLGDMIDVICAISLHEGTHAEETKKTPDMETTHQSEHFIWNVIEDVWIELLKSIEFPGYYGYFLRGRKYITEDTVPDGKKLKTKSLTMSQAESDKIEYTNRMNAFLLALRATDNWKIPDEYSMCQEAVTLVQRTLAEHYVTGRLRQLDRIKLAERAYRLIFQDEVKKEEQRPNQGFTKPYFGNGNGNGTGTGNPLKRGNQPATQPSNPGPSGPKNHYFPESTDDIVNELNEKADKISSKLVHAILKRWGIDSRTAGDGLGGAAGEYHIWAQHENQPKMNLSKEVLDKVKQFIEQKIEIIDQPGTHEDYMTTIYKPEATDNEIAVYERTHSQVLSEIMLLRNQFIWARNERSYTVTGLRSGDLDNYLLAEIPYNDMVFSRQRKLPRQTRELDAIIFVDESGSMGGTSIDTARKMSVLLYEGLHDIIGVQTFVYGYTTGGRTMLNLQEYITPQRRNLPQFFMSVGGMRARGATPTAEALYQVWKRGEKLGRRHVSKLFINISDGEPADDVHGYGSAHNEKVKEIAQKMRVQGHELIHIALDNFSVSRDIYNRSIDWPGDYKQLIEMFAAELRMSLLAR